MLLHETIYRLIAIGQGYPRIGSLRAGGKPPLPPLGRLPNLFVLDRVLMFLDRNRRLVA
jgi:hypothetical protein